MATYGSRAPIKVPQVPNSLDGERGLHKFHVDTVRAMRDIANRLTLLEQTLTDSGLGTTSNVAGETGIIPNMLVHCTDAGVAFLASAADATLYATGIVTAVHNGLILVKSAVTTDVYTSPNTSVDENTPKLFLSIIPGYATTDAAEATAAFMQCVGWSMGTRNTTNGKLRADIRCDFRSVLLT